MSSQIDNNSLSGGLNIKKRELSVKGILAQGILAQDLGFVWKKRDVGSRTTYQCRRFSFDYFPNYHIPLLRPL
jgi:hypothetical protein